MSEKDKRFLEDIKKQIDGLNYYIQGIRVIDKDKQKLDHVKNTVADLSIKLDKTIYQMGKELRIELGDKVESRHRTSLTKINSPTNDMVKNSEFNTSIRKALLGGRLNIIKEASDRLFKKASDETSTQQS
jgi:hypothetical protein